jgi:hypothetical protein
MGFSIYPKTPNILTAKQNC